jgi:hypothetical protein
MRICPFDLAPVLPEDAVFLWIDRIIPSWIGWGALGGTASLMLPLLWRFLGAFSTANWILRLYGQRILLPIGPVNSNDPSGVFVAEFQSKEVAWVRSRSRTTTTRDADGTRVTSSTTWLELAEHGRIIEATELARQRSGHSLAGAREFVVRLRRKDAAALPGEGAGNGAGEK